MPKQAKNGRVEWGSGNSINDPHYQEEPVRMLHQLVQDLPVILGVKSDA